METIYLGFVIFLFVLAIFDLMVGVSNDAVNFLNSAVGAKTASFKVIIIVAAIGVFLGATMSNGMMDIAPRHLQLLGLAHIHHGVDGLRIARRGLCDVDGQDSQ